MPKDKPLAAGHDIGATVRYAGHPADEGVVVGYTHSQGRRWETVRFFGGRRGTEIHDATHLIELCAGVEVERRHHTVWPG